MTRRSPARDVRGAVVHGRVVSAVRGTTLVATGVGLGTAEPDLLWAAVLAGVLGVWSPMGALRPRLAQTSESVIVASALRTRRMRCYASAAPRRPCRRVAGRLRAELAAAPR